MATEEEESTEQRTSNDLFIGLVRAIGTDLNDSIDALETCFKRAGYVDADFVTVDFTRFFPDILERITQEHGTAPLSSPTRQPRAMNTTRPTWTRETGFAATWAGTLSPV